MWCLIFIFLPVEQIIGLRYIEVGNQNGFPIWIQTKPNDKAPPLRNGEIVKLNTNDRTKFDIDDTGWGGRLWAKVGCDDNGSNCEFGQSVEPCPDGGCQPPADTKVEFFFSSINSPDASYYDISLVDGYSLASEITPFKDGQPIQDGSCVRTDCHLLLSDCPKNEKCELGDLTVKGRNNNIVACLSPCKKWNYPTPYGYGRDEQQGDGRMLCCPDPVTPEDCRKGIVAQTDYVNLLHRACKTAYSYSYDDEGGLHTCPSQASFVVNYSS